MPRIQVGTSQNLACFACVIPSALFDRFLGVASNLYKAVSAVSAVLRDEASRGTSHRPAQIRGYLIICWEVSTGQEGFMRSRAMAFYLADTNGVLNRWRGWGGCYTNLSFSDSNHLLSAIQNIKCFFSKLLAHHSFICLRDNMSINSRRSAAHHSTNYIAYARCHFAIRVNKRFTSRILDIAADFFRKRGDFSQTAR